jgi:N-acetylglucosamine kinase-like BadF-type ATPase
MKILLADSGSTKTDWCVVTDGTATQQVATKGTNPFFQTEEEIVHEIKTALLPSLSSTEFDEVHFYGAGCAFPDKIEVLHRTLTSLLTVSGFVEVKSDVVAAARALCGHQPGIACILGTGSNSCYYDGADVVNNVSPLGYILGDEGGGAYLGKRLVGDILKNQTTPELKEAFLAQYELTAADIIERVYRRPFPNRFLASLAPFIIQHIDQPSMHLLALDAFRQFFRRNVMQYDYRDYPVGFVGSVAFYYQDIIREAAAEVDGITIGHIIKSPMEGLIKYHQ